MPLVLTVPPFKLIPLAVALKLERAAVLPRPALIATLAFVPDALSSKALAVPSLLIVPLVVITAALPLAASLALEAKVIAPA